VTHLWGVFSTASEPHTGQRSFFLEETKAKAKTTAATAKIVIISAKGTTSSKMALPPLQED